jgi:hypothetical protein
MKVKTRAVRDVSGNLLTRFLSDTAMSVASKLIKVSSARALMHEFYDWEEEFDSAKFYEDIDNLQEISKLLDEAYENYFSKSPDGSAKGSDGSLTVSFGTYFDRKHTGIKVTNIRIYSYIFCKERSIDFSTTEEALIEIKKWHAKEMALDYGKMKEYDDRYSYLITKWLAENPDKKISEGEESVVQQLESEGLRWDFYND